ncbi:MAG: glycosyltransferase family protein [Chlamydiales bacterium]|nr:glycosyltransferase family protein [Chlamydiia bacterium]MCP5507176.1 glycosyltransferase family protein [Chlamydiales bacterium]
MGSTRLPGKLLLEVAGRPLLSYQIERLKRAKFADRIVVATTTNPRDEQIVDFCRKEKVSCYRGSEEDVLDRYERAAQEYGADIIVRITSDCPLIDPAIVDQVIAYYFEHRDRFDYVSNTIQRTFPRGMDVEVFPYDKLEEIAARAVAPHEREHVTPYFYEHQDRYRLGSVSNDRDLSSYRWTVDTEEDFTLVSKIINALYRHKPNFTLDDLLNLFKKHPDWKNINVHVKQKPLKT